jgi:tetratricopeptide (TPR) repeat protein
VMENIRRRKNPAYTIKDARRAFLTATEDEPRNPAYMTALGFSYYAEGDIEQADDTWSQVLNLSDRKEYPKDNSDLVMAKAGMALVYFKESEKEPENKSRAIKFREYVRANADLNNLPDWRWSEGAISDWKKLIVLKNNSSLPNEAQ